MNPLLLLVPCFHTFRQHSGGTPGRRLPQMRQDLDPEDLDPLVLPLTDGVQRKSLRNRSASSLAGTSPTASMYTTASRYVGSPTRRRPHVSGSARCESRVCQRSPCRIHTHARCHLDALRTRLGRARESAYSPGPCREWVGRSVAGRGPHSRRGLSRRSNRFAHPSKFPNCPCWFK